MLRHLLLEELIVYELGDNFHHVIFCCGLVESVSESLAYNRVP
jgi:hypothetical protein